MNILQFADYGAPYEGNFIQSLTHLENKLSGDKTVYLFTKVAQNQEWTKKLQNVFFLRGNLFENIKIFRKIIKEEHIDIIHTHFSVLKYDLALKIARMTSKKTIYIRHMHMLYKPKGNFIFEKIKTVISNADIEIACSDAAYDAMVSAGSIKKERLYMVPNGIAFERFDRYETLEKNSRHILMFGYNYAVKGVDLAIKAVEKLVSAGEDIRLNIVIAKNDQLIKKTIEENFNAVPGFVELLPPRNDIATYYKHSDLFLSASREESFCYAVREAAYCECPVVASDIPAHNDIPADFRFKSGDDLDLYKKLAFTINLKNKQEIIRTSKEFVIKKYSIESWSRQISDIYNTLKTNTINNAVQ